MAAGGGQEGDGVIKGDRKLVSAEDIERAIKEGRVKDIDAPKDPQRAKFSDDEELGQMLSNDSDDPLAWAKKPGSGVEFTDEFKKKQ